MSLDQSVAVRLSKLVPPEAGYQAIALPEHPGYRVGKAANGALVFLTPPDTQPDPPTRLRRLILLPRVEIAVRSENQPPVHEEAGVVELDGSDTHLLPLFLRVVIGLAEVLGAEPQPREVSRAMQRLISLFEPASGQRGSVAGLWGELFTIQASSDPRRLVDAWHVSASDAYDFTEPGSCLEVKTSTRMQRHHSFRLHQLNPPAGKTVVVVSIHTSPTDAGLSLNDLVDSVCSAMDGDVDRVLKILELVAQTLGPDWPTVGAASFDQHQAEHGLQVVDVCDVPKVSDPPPEVVSVELTVDFTDLPATTDTAEGSLASTLL